ncbi:integrin alpha-6-like isoform X2 [Engraulis encrasicolus]|uniref:integrin alpha-6-like isoform X2 n=1 Tax=Engraulis encrasicolus TaxID=184585 RepID=UPI002FD6B52F
MGSFKIRPPIVCLLLFWTHAASPFNLDTENVIIKQGEKDSLFGFSLAMHRQLSPADKRHLLVGAPRTSGRGATAAVATGALYTCDISDPGTSCTRVALDEELDVSQESKDNQWLGVVVQSQRPGGKVLTCAHRYQRRRYVGSIHETWDIMGRCFALAQDLTMDPDQDSTEGDHWMFCKGRRGGHARFGSCQQGLSATFTKDGPLTGDEHYLIFGAPGAYNWKGIVRLEQKNDTLPDLGIWDDGPYEVGGETNQDENLVPVPPNSYLGFSLDSSRTLTKRGELVVVAGAPRANHSGAVVFLTKGKNNDMVPVHILDGEGLASSFGYDLTVVDLNADGWQDLVVGAPQYFEKEGDVGGAIYVYINKAGDWNAVQPLRIDGSKDSMFGLSVKNIGDVNLDGYQDVAVGAPYDDGGAGKVFIYHGSAEGIQEKPAQVLSAKGQGVQLFGYSLAGNMDLDNNVYPDLAVGSLSDVVHIYRARPVINLEKNVEFSPKELSLTKKNCPEGVCLEVKACFFYTANPSTINPKIVLKYKFQAEKQRREQGLPTRVTFSQRSPDDPDYESSGTLLLNSQKKKQCLPNPLKVIVKENIKDKLRGIPIEVSVELDGGSRNRRDLPGLTPILDSSKPTSILYEVGFVKPGCGQDNICQSKLDVKYEFCSRIGNSDNFKPLGKRNGVQLIPLRDQKDIALKVTVTNSGDDAYEAALVASFPNTLSYSTTRPIGAVICGANQNGSQAECELGNPFKTNSVKEFYIVMSTGGISANTTEVEIDLQLKTTSQQEATSVKARAEVTVELQLSVIGVARPSQVYYSGGKSESDVKTESEIGSLVEYEFRIINLGKPLESYGMAALTIHWPAETHNGKHLLYAMSITSSLEGQTCTHTGAINPVARIKEEPSARVKREVASARTAEEGTISARTDRKNDTLWCGHGARCKDIRCPLVGMKSDADIRLKARLWNLTFSEDYKDLNYLTVFVKATLTLDVRSSNFQLKNPETTATLTVFPERRMAQYSGLPWWIILVAILLGLLLLALLIFLLWKCGFFGNKEDDPSEKEKLTSEA